jgi:hypothetical protein
LKTLDAATAANVERLVRAALELAEKSKGSEGTPGLFEETSGELPDEPSERPPQGEFLPADFFESIAEEFGDEPFERPPQGQFEERREW